MNKYLEAIETYKVQFNKKKLKIAFKSMMYIVLLDLRDGNITFEEFYAICKILNETICQKNERDENH